MEQQGICSLTYLKLASFGDKSGCLTNVIIASGGKIATFLDRIVSSTTILVGMVGWIVFLQVREIDVAEKF